jgi:Protein of unknown function (DUF993)
MPSVTLPDGRGGTELYRPGPPSPYPSTASHAFPREAYAAAHVVADPQRVGADGMPLIDWEATLAFRRHLFGLGFRIAEAMDTSQRGMGLGWPQAAFPVPISPAVREPINGRPPKQQVLRP